MASLFKAAPPPLSPVARELPQAGAPAIYSSRMTPEEPPSPQPFTADDATFFREALAFARIAYAEREVPIGAVVVRDGRIVGRGRNQREARADPTAHAEIEALREAGQAAGTWHLDGATLYATLEPCAMCAGAAVNARIARIVYGCPDPKAGYCGTLGNIPQDPRLNHRCEVVGGLLAEESAALLQQFFRAKRGAG